MHSAYPDDFAYPHDRAPRPAPLLDARRMSEPALYDIQMQDRYHSQPQYPFPAPSAPANRLAAPLYPSALHRGASTGALRDLRQHHFDYPPQQQEWKHDQPRQRDHHQLDYFNHRADSFDEPTSPMQATFSHNLMGSPSGLQYSPLSDNLYGPSPPGTGTSTASSSVPPLSAGLPTSPSHSISQHLQRSLSASQLSGDNIDRKTYSFVSLPGNTVKKRPRRRYDEIERLYVCSWPDCNKSYGTLNHLNAHVTMQKHGNKRSPNEFKDLRKQWRKAKKEQEVAAAAAMRRDSFSDGYDDHHSFGHRYLSQHHALSQRHISSSVDIPSAERYPVPVDGLRFTPNDRDDGLSYEAANLTARPRYGLQAASWNDTSSMSHRVNAVQQQRSFGNGDLNTPSSFPSYAHAHYSQLPQLNVGSGRMQPHPSTVPDSQSALMHQNLDGSHQNQRLSESSTLLTPLPGHSTPSMISSMQAGGGGLGFPESYELYETDIDNGSRPGTGHASLGGHASTDEYSQ